MRYVSMMLAGGLFWAATTAAAAVNVNEADAAALAEMLNGIGEVKAQAIVDYREENGPFRSADALTAVDGIGPKTVEQIRDDVRVTKPRD